MHGLALAALVAATSAGAGVAFIVPLVALVIAAIAAKEGAPLWRGEDCGCQAISVSDRRRRSMRRRLLQSVAIALGAPARDGFRLFAS